MFNVVRESMTKLVTDAPFIVIGIGAIWKLWKHQETVLEKRHDEQTVAFRESTSAIEAATSAIGNLQSVLDGIKTSVKNCEGTVDDNTKRIVALEGAVNLLQVKMEEVNSSSKETRDNTMAVRISVEGCRLKGRNPE